MNRKHLHRSINHAVITGASHAKIYGPIEYNSVLSSNCRLKRYSGLVGLLHLYRKLNTKIGDSGAKCKRPKKESFIDDKEIK
jgi:hypothetical protein